VLSWVGAEHQRSFTGHAPTGGAGVRNGVPSRRFGSPEVALPECIAGEGSEDDRPKRQNSGGASMRERKSQGFLQVGERVSIRSLIWQMVTT
jgi:hypothetical protein